MAARVDEESEIVIAGGGPAGLALALRCARAGFRTLLLERNGELPDKACGEGLMPHGVRALEALGVRGAIPLELQHPFAGIRYQLEDGRAVDARFRRGSGLGIRRIALSAALREAALRAGARLEQATVRGHRLDAGGIQIETDCGAVRAKLLVGADGLQSTVRRAAGLELESGEISERRFGLRRHFACAPWSDLVEVHWIDFGECYVTPVGPALVNVAFLWEPRAPGFTASAARLDATASAQHVRDPFAELLARFPTVASHLGSAASASESRGAGPLSRPTRGRVAERVALIGDAAGYVDAITGQGLSLAFAGAEALSRALPRDLGDARALSAALGAYDRSLRAAYRAYALPARALLALARRPRLRRAALGFAVRLPRLFSTIVEAIASQ